MDIASVRQGTGSAAHRGARSYGHGRAVCLWRPDLSARPLMDIASVRQGTGSAAHRRARSYGHGRAVCRRRPRASGRALVDMAGLFAADGPTYRRALSWTSHLSGRAPAALLIDARVLMDMAGLFAFGGLAHRGALLWTWQGCLPPAARSISAHSYGHGRAVCRRRPDLSARPLMDIASVRQGTGSAAHRRARSYGHGRAVCRRRIRSCPRSWPRAPLHGLCGGADGLY